MVRICLDPECIVGFREVRCGVVGTSEDDRLDFHQTIVGEWRVQRKDGQSIFLLNRHGVSRWQDRQIKPLDTVKSLGSFRSQWYFGWLRELVHR